MRFVSVFLLLSAVVYSTHGAEPPQAIVPFDANGAKTHQRAWAEHLQQPTQMTNSLGMKFSLVPPGRFTMGSPQDEQWHREDEVQHLVTLSRPFYMGTTEVTQAHFQGVMEENPSFFSDETLPVETVTWEQAVQFCRKLSEKEGARYRLPTEAEWEYACRAGTTILHTGATITPRQANYDGNRIYAGGPKGVFRETTTTAGSLAENAWGIYDMHGNVWEWCSDWYGEYSETEVRDPTGPASGDRRVFRGGCWINFPAVCRSANRAKVKPISWNFHLGSCAVRELDETP